MVSNMALDPMMDTMNSPPAEGAFKLQSSNHWLHLSKRKQGRNTSYYSSDVPSSVPLFQLRLQLLKALQCALEVFDDVVSQHVGRGQAVQIGKGLVLDPENIEAGLVPRKDVGNIKFAPAAIRVILAPCLGALITILRVIAGDEVQ